MKYMKVVFIFFLRLFCAFVAAKFILRVFDQDHRTYLIGLTLLFTANLYWFDFLEYRSRISFYLKRLKKSAPPPAAPGEETPAPEPPREA